MAKRATRTSTMTDRKSKTTATPAVTSARRKAAAPRRKSSGLGLTSVTPTLARLAKEMTAAMATAAAPGDAIALLKADHRKVEQLFEDFEAAERNAEKGKLAAQICLELRVHAKIEEELLYPPAHEEIEEDIVDEAIVEHAVAKNLIKQIEAMKPGEHLFDAKVKVLGEYIKHHVKEEENEMFPQLRQSGLDLAELGAQLKARKQELLEQISAKR